MPKKCCNIEVRPSGKSVLAARVPSALAHRVIEVAQEHGLSISDVVRAALDEFVEFHITNAEIDRIFKRSEPVSLTTGPPIRAWGCAHVSVSNSGAVVPGSITSGCGCELRPIPSNY